MLNIIALVGSNAEKSYNRLLLQFIAKHFQDKANVELAEIKDIPMFDESDIIPTVQELADKIESADGVIISCPEYTNSLSSALKSVLEWLSHQVTPFKGKPVMIVGASTRRQGTSRSQLHLRQVLDSPGLFANVMPGNEFLMGNAQNAFDEEGNIKDSGTINFLESCIDNFIRFASVSNDLNKEEEITFTPGVYHTTAVGHNGQLPMEVEFSADRIEAIRVENSQESDGLSDEVFKVIPQQIIDYQTLNIDTISGASTTSKGLIEGVSEAVKQASDSPRAVEVIKGRPKPKKVVNNEVEDLNFDAVVIGGGAAGIAAALRLDQLGHHTALIEKQSFVGGAISISGGNQVVMGSQLQKESGVTDDSVQSMIDDFKANGNNENSEDLLELFAKEVGPTTDWLNEYVGIQYDMDGGLHVLAEYQNNRELAYLNGGPGFAASARAKLDQSNVELFKKTQAIELLTDDDRVTGVICKQDDGKTLKLHSQAVILTTGGYGNNKEFLTDELESVLYYGPQSATGDGLNIALSISAETINMPYGKIYPNGIEISPGIAKSTIDGNLRVLKENAILVNREGKRVVNERASNKDILTVLLEQNPQVLYLLLDQEAFEKFRDGVAEAGITSKQLEDWLEQEDSLSPQFIKADSIGGLAKKAHISDETLTNTVNQFNQYVQDQSDPDFDRPVEYLQKEIGPGPYYLIEQKPRFATTLGGLLVNDKLEVQNKNQRSIKNLYAAGEVVGGVMGTDSPSGANNAWALTSGKQAAESINNQLIK
ncbi:FAD-dependent oxidoreductase [Hutsoniella sourekii]